MSTRAENFEQVKSLVLEEILRGKEGAVTRHWLWVCSGANDRVVRKAIEELRNEGHLICNDQDGYGYYIAETDEDILRQYRRDCARAVSILKRLKAFRKAARLIEQKEENKDQVTIEEILMLMEGKL